MKNNTIILAKIAFVDRMLDDFEDELGDIPQAIKLKEGSISDKKIKIAETETLINEIKMFVNAAQVSLSALKEKEDKLSSQQFLVRNNKEFDAINGEVKAIKNEHEQLAVKMRHEGQKEANMLAILEEQKQTLEQDIIDLKNLNEQFEELLEEHSGDIKEYNDIRKQLKEQLAEDIYDRYSKIRKRITDAAVNVRKDSCMGCYRQIPKQIIVDMRNQTERIFQCENCGRLLIPDWATFDEDNILES